MMKLNNLFVLISKNILLLLIILFGTQLSWAEEKVPKKSNEVLLNEIKETTTTSTNNKKVSLNLLLGQGSYNIYYLYFIIGTLKWHYQTENFVIRNGYKKLNYRDINFDNILAKVELLPLNVNQYHQYKGNNFLCIIKTNRICFGRREEEEKIYITAKLIKNTKPSYFLVKDVNPLLFYLNNLFGKEISQEYNIPASVATQVMEKF